MNITCLIFAIIFSFITIMFLLDKGHVFIPHWKELSEEDKKKIPIHELSQNMAIVLGCCSFILIISSFFENFREHYFSFAMVLWLIGTGIDVYYIEKSKRFKK